MDTFHIVRAALFANIIILSLFFSEKVYLLIFLVALHKKMKFSIKDFFNKQDPIHSFQWIRSHLLEKSLTENFIFTAV